MKWSRIRFVGMAAILFDAFYAGPALGVEQPLTSTTQSLEGGHMADELVLETRFEVTPNSLNLTYKVENRGNLDAYLLNRLYRPGPPMDLSPDLVYTRLERNLKAVVLEKKIANIPGDRNVAAPVAPFVTPVRSGASFSETIRVPIPVNEYREYSLLGHPKNPPRLVEYQRASFTLGFYWSAPGVVDQTQNYDGVTVVIPRFPPGMRPLFGELSGDSGAIKIPVIETN